MAETLCDGDVLIDQDSLISAGGSCDRAYLSVCLGRPRVYTRKAEESHARLVLERSARFRMWLHSGARFGCLRSTARQFLAPSLWRWSAQKSEMPMKILYMDGGHFTRHRYCITLIFYGTYGILIVCCFMFEGRYQLITVLCRPELFLLYLSCRVESQYGSTTLKRYDRKTSVP